AGSVALATPAAVVAGLLPPPDPDPPPIPVIPLDFALAADWPARMASLAQPATLTIAERERLRGAGPTLATAGGGLDPLGKGHIAELAGFAFSYGNTLAANALGTRLRLDRSTSQLAMRVDLNGAKPLAHATPMALSYDGNLSYTYANRLSLGVVARGDLGTFGNFAPPADHVAGAVAKLQFHPFGTSFNAETDYLVTMGPAALATPPNLRVKLNLAVPLGR
ncbi:MAG TPA: hypothetical protein VFF98_17130, partial [Novosphingobium sp.]|nr:hypothetical protein [Novosphingobium sp.]